MLLVGADPELFVKRNGVYESGYDMIPGTKARPHPVPYGAVQVDGMALEFNINPASNEEEFVFHIDNVMNQLRAMVPDVEVVADPVAHFTHEYLAQQPDEAIELGCDPDYNAWTGRRNDPPNVKAAFRTGSGHVHAGWLNGDVPDNHEELCHSLVKQFDFYLGLPSLLYDDDKQRRELYGKAGAYRAKPYGVEYRVLSNRWLASDSLKRWVYRNTLAAFNSMDRQLVDIYGDIQDIINNSRVEQALEIIKREGIELPEEVRHVG